MHFRLKNYISTRALKWKIETVKIVKVAASREWRKFSPEEKNVYRLQARSGEDGSDDRTRNELGRFVRDPEVEPHIPEIVGAEQTPEKKTLQIQVERGDLCRNSCTPIAFFARRRQYSRKVTRQKTADESHGYWRHAPTTAEIVLHVCVCPA